MITLLLIAPLIIPFLDYLAHGVTSAHQANLFNSIRIPPPGIAAAVAARHLRTDHRLPGPGWRCRHDLGVRRRLPVDVTGSLGVARAALAASCGLVVVLVAWVLLGLSRSYGEPPLIGNVFDVVPGMSQVDFFRSATSSIELALIILAGPGVDDLIAKRVPLRRLIITTIAALGLIAVAAVAAEPLVHQLGNNPHSRFSKGPVLWGAGIVVAASLAALVRRPRVRAGCWWGCSPWT